ncbi:hypothetical protein [[Muricauda] lutisoli]|uniref:Uncharacterized protein n=1 Tax=[Muricauda] lutisoli TaxID=2816035 RepID=A0ABS3ES22_9FLAO|nr:hypothetical protein [[Muricauda] lutisoli]MBO0328922.1 hypothetical protein [[Muricauda] lutisoli]
MHKANFIILSILLITVSCKREQIEPFELSVADYNYSLAYSVLYKLTNEKMTITFRGELENEKDSVLYETSDLPYKELMKLSQVNLDSLGVYYSNPCISDGDIKVYKFKKNGIAKQIQMENYYHKDISPVIEMINKIVPEKFEMYHDKKDLIESLEQCGESYIKMSWDENQ